MKGSKLFVLFFVVCAVGLVVLMSSQPVYGQQVWTGYSYTFTKADWANWTDPANQDRITSQTWITRQDYEGIFNIAMEGGYSYPPSPANTEWAYGSATDWASLTFQPWADWLGWWPRYNILHRPAVLHLINEDIYLDIKFVSWTCCANGGGFTYVRATGPPRVWTGLSYTFTKPDYADWTDPLYQDRITRNVAITRRDVEGVFNRAWEVGFGGWTSGPVNTEWASGSAADWASLTFEKWVEWLDYWPCYNIVGQPAVLHLIHEDVYIDIEFTSWTCSAMGGGFSYERATEGVPGEKIWTGPPITFTKSDYADWTQPSNQDRITPYTWLTRQDQEGLFNFRMTDEYHQYLSPWDTEWAYGSAANWASLTFQPWRDWHGGDPLGYWGGPGIVGQDAVVHLISDNIYLDIKFLSWTSGGMMGMGGGGFSYIRAAPSFEVTASPDVARVQWFMGLLGTATYDVTVSSIGSYSGTVNLSAAGFPLGYRRHYFHPTDVVTVPAGGSQTVQLVVEVTRGTPVGDYPLTIIGDDGISTDSDGVIMEVRRPSPFRGPLTTKEGVPTAFELAQNYPNPFNPETSIDFGLPQDGQVRLAVYNMLGQEVEVLVNEEVPAGYYTVSWDAAGLPTGVYFCRIEANNFTETRRMVLIK